MYVYIYTYIYLYIYIPIYILICMHMEMYLSIMRLMRFGYGQPPRSGLDQFPPSLTQPKRPCSPFP